MWFLFALLSAVFAALTSILAKIADRMYSDRHGNAGDGAVKGTYI